MRQCIHIRLKGTPDCEEYLGKLPVASPSSPFNHKLPVRSSSHIHPALQSSIAGLPGIRPKLFAGQQTGLGNCLLQARMEGVAII